LKVFLIKPLWIKLIVFLAPIKIKCSIMMKKIKVDKETDH